MSTPTLNGSGLSLIAGGGADAATFGGTWNANTNTPTLASGVGVANTYYVVSVAGATNLNGVSTWVVGDWAFFDGTTWSRVVGGAVLTIQGVAGGYRAAVVVQDSSGVALDYTIPAPIVQAAATSVAVTSVNSLATNATLLAATSTRLHASIYNSDVNTLYIKLGATATTSDYSYAIPAGATWDMPYRYVGIIDGIWAADGAGAAKITSFLNV